VRKKILLIGFACLLLIMIVTALFGKKGVMDLRRARRVLAKQAETIRTLEEEKTRLEAEVLRLERDPRAIEKQAREKLGLIEPGEKVVVVPSPSPGKK
jgi:cell division protein FtsB